MSILIFIISFLFVFGILVFVHELGHFIAAKRSKIEVQEFAFGFPPRLFSKKIGGTEYSINAIPFGGYVRILGEDGSEKNNPNSFSHKSKLVKAKVLSAGVVMNTILAWIILSFLYAIGFLPLIPGMENHKGVSQYFKVENIESNSPAMKTGVQKGDEILRVDEKTINNAIQLRDEMKHRIGQETKVEIKRNGQIKNFNVIPFKDTIEGKEIGRIGIETSEKIKSDSIFLAPVSGFQELWRLSVITIVGIVDVFSKIFTQFTISQDVVGPAGIVYLTGQVSQLGFTFLLQFMAILSISLALFNILPIPALDGGHLLFLAIEKIRGKDISIKSKNTVTIAGFVLLIFLVLIVTPRDLNRFGIIEGIKKFLGI